MKRLGRIALFIVFLTLGTSIVGANGYANEQIEFETLTCAAIPTNGGIRLMSDTKTVFDIYSITGQRIKSISIDSDSQTIELPKGCYIVRCSQWSKKVVVN